MTKLIEQQNKPIKNEQQKIHRQTVHNYYPTYTLLDEEYQALYFGPDT